MQRYHANPNQQPFLDSHGPPKGTPQEMIHPSSVTVMQGQRNAPSSVESTAAALPANQTSHNPKHSQHGFSSQMTPAQKLSILNEQSWIKIGSIAEMMTDYKKAMHAYEMSLKHNPYSLPSLQRIALLFRQQEDFEKAVEYYQRIIGIDATEGETWGAIGHCYLMMNELQKAFNAYQQALYHLADRKEPKLWYGIGILYECYNSYESAEEAFNAVMQMDPNFEKANEIYFRLGIIYKCQQRYKESLNCFKSIIHSPPKPLTENDIWFQIGNVNELQEDFNSALRAYERVLNEDPNHSKVLLQLGILFMRPETDLYNPETSSMYLNRAVEVDKSDAQAWYALGRCGMLLKQYNNAYEAYQQAVYCDATNATYWCSIGVLYYQINQYRDALDAYSRSIRLDPLSSEVWFNLGTLYETCNNQINDAIDAYHRASELDPKNTYIIERLNVLQQIKENRKPSGPTTPPLPIDPPISDLQNPPPNPQQDTDGQNRLPGSLGHPPVSAQGPSLYSMVNDRYRNKGDESTDNYSEQHKEALKAAPRLNESSYVSYPPHNGNLDQEGRSNQSALGVSRHSPHLHNLGAEIGRGADDVPGRSNLGRSSPGVVRPYNYGPNHSSQYSVQQHPSNRATQSRISDPAARTPKANPSHVSRHSQSSASHQPKQGFNYSPINAYDPRPNSVIKKQSPPSQATENVPYGPDPESVGPGGHHYKSSHNQLFSGPYSSDQYPLPSDSYPNQSDKAGLRSPSFDRYSTNGVTPVEKSRNNTRTSIAQSSGIDSSQPSSFPRDDARQPPYQTERGQPKVDKSYPHGHPSRFGSKYPNGNDEQNTSPQKPDQGIKSEQRQSYRPNNTPSNSYYNNRSQPPQPAESFGLAAQKINSDRRNNYNNPPKSYSQASNFSPPLVTNSKRFHVSQSPKNNKLNDFNSERRSSDLAAGYPSDSAQDSGRKFQRQWAPGSTRDSLNQNTAQDLRDQHSSQQERNIQEDPQTYYKSRNSGSVPGNIAGDRSDKYYLPSKSPVLKKYGNSSNSGLSNTSNNSYPENQETTNSKVPADSSGAVGQYPRSYKHVHSMEYKTDRNTQSPDFQYQENGASKSLQGSESQGIVGGSTFSEPRSKSPLSTKSGPIHVRPATPQQKIQLYNQHSNSQSNLRQSHRPDSGPLSNNSAPNSAQLPQIAQSTPAGYGNSSNSKNSHYPLSMYNSPLAHSNKEKTSSKSPEPEKLSPNSSSAQGRSQDRLFLGYQNMENGAVKSENDLSVVPVKRKNESPNSQVNLSPKNVRSNSTSDSGSSKSDSNKPLYKRMCTTNTPSQDNFEQGPRNESLSQRGLTPEKEGSSEPRELRDISDDKQGVPSVENESEKHSGLGIDTSSQLKAQNTNEEPEDGEVFEEEDGSRAANKDTSHSITYGANLENFRVLRTESASPRDLGPFSTTPGSYSNEPRSASSKNEANLSKGSEKNDNISDSEKNQDHPE